MKGSGSDYHTHGPVKSKKKFLYPTYNSTRMSK